MADDASKPKKPARPDETAVVPITPEHLDGTTPYVSRSGRVLTPAQVRALKNLRPVTKGHQVGGAGRKRGRSISASLQAKMDKRVRTMFDLETVQRIPKSYADKKIVDAIADVLLKEALKGNAKCALIVLDRTEGPVAHRLAGHDGGPLTPQQTPQQILAALREAHGLDPLTGEPKAIEGGGDVSEPA
jgi:hypothetical protein